MHVQISTEVGSDCEMLQTQTANAGYLQQAYIHNYNKTPRRNIKCQFFIT